MRQGRVKMETAAELVFIGIDVSRDAVPSKPHRR
jgi:hypothetical protein